MLKTLSLILPALLPSWRFFEEVAPSPRIQWAVLDRHGAPTGGWHEFRPRPATVTLWQMLARLFWNPERNEALFMVSCAERVAVDGDILAVEEITRRIEQTPEAPAGTLVRFRLEFVHHDAAGWTRDVLFESAPIRAGGQRAP